MHSLFVQESKGKERKGEKSKGRQKKENYKCRSYRIRSVTKFCALPDLFCLFSGSWSYMPKVTACTWYKLLFADNEHSDRQPKRDWHVCIILQSPFKEWLDDDRPDTWQRLRPVRMSILVHKQAIVVYGDYFNLWNCHHDSEPLHRRHLPDTLQDSKNMTLYI